MNNTTAQNKVRPPVIAVMGHIDHGKSSLLDYIRKTKTTEGEAGGITQHLSAYELLHTDEAGAERRITFIDTPGHEAFQSMRSRGATVADIVILVVSAEDGVKAQTLEALKAIVAADIPYVVAINKIDLPNADIERTKMNLLEHEIYLEGLGGKVPYVPLSAKTGEGIDALLDMVLLVADMEELTFTPTLPATGVVIESNRDPKKGIAATLLIKEGSLKGGAYVVAQDTYAPTRILEDFAGKKIDYAEASSPITIVGFTDVPEVGAQFTTHENKKEAEGRAENYTAESVAAANTKEQSADHTVVPVIVKADALGTIDAIAHELKKLENERVSLRILHSGVGNISESDIQRACGDEVYAAIVGFGVGVDSAAQELARRHDVSLEVFDVIYHLSEWLAKIAKERTPERVVRDTVGKAKILKVFSAQKQSYLLGGRMQVGTLSVGDSVSLMREEETLTEGKIASLQAQKVAAQSVKEGDEFGAQIEFSVEPLPGDTITAFLERKE